MASGPPGWWMTSARMTLHSPIRQLGGRRPRRRGYWDREGGRSDPRQGHASKPPQQQTNWFLEGAWSVPRRTARIALLYPDRAHQAALVKFPCRYPLVQEPRSGGPSSAGPVILLVIIGRSSVRIRPRDPKPQVNVGPG